MGLAAWGRSGSGGWGKVFRSVHRDLDLADLGGEAKGAALTRGLQFLPFWDGE